MISIYRYRCDDCCADNRRINWATSSLPIYLWANRCLHGLTGPVDVTAFSNPRPWRPATLCNRPRRVSPARAEKDEASCGICCMTKTD